MGETDVDLKDRISHPQPASKANSRPVALSEDLMCHASGLREPLYTSTSFLTVMPVHSPSIPHALDVLRRSPRRGGRRGSSRGRRGHPNRLAGRRHVATDPRPPTCARTGRAGPPESPAPAPTGSCGMIARQPVDVHFAESESQKRAKSPKKTTVCYIQEQSNRVHLTRAKAEAARRAAGPPGDRRRSHSATAAASSRWSDCCPAANVFPPGHETCHSSSGWRIPQEVLQRR